MPADLKSRLDVALISYQDEMFDFLRDLLAIPTENPPGARYRECARLLAERLEELGLVVRWIEAPPAQAANSSESSPGYCLLSDFGNGDALLYFHGHYDVVPASAPEQFHPTLTGDSLFARGAADMKGGLVAMIYAVRALRDLDVRLRGRIRVVFVPDEETGGARGTRYLAAQGLLEPGGVAMVTPEPTGGLIWNSSRGAISFRVTVRGRPAHVGLHYLGANAFEGMLAAARALEDLKREVEARETGFPIGPAAARRSILLLGGQCRGGVNFNSVPEECWFTVDRRINPEENLAEEKQRLLDVLEHQRARGVNLDVSFLQEEPASATPEGHPAARALASTVEEVYSGRPRFELCPGLLETRFYAQLGIPAFAWSPALLTVAHGPQEFIKLADVRRCALVYALAACRLLGEEAA
ncbi:MAG: ArgE/DapE family deacylase [Candidatus Acidiferrales bacterium]